MSLASTPSLVSNRSLTEPPAIWPNSRTISSTRVFRANGAAIATASGKVFREHVAAFPAAKAEFDYRVDALDRKILKSTQMPAMPRTGRLSAFRTGAFPAALGRYDPTPATERHARHDYAGAQHNFAVFVIRQICRTLRPRKIGTKSEEDPFKCTVTLSMKRPRRLGLLRFWRVGGASLARANRSICAMTRA